MTKGMGISELDAITTLAAGDLVEVSQYNGGEYASKKIDLVGNAANVRAALGIQQAAISLIASAQVDCQDTAKQTFYTVPAGKIFIPVLVVVREPSASLAGMTDFDLGAGANADDWLQQVSLDAFTATTDYGILTQPEQAAGPPVVPVKKTVYAEGAAWGIKINTGSTSAATATFDLFGYLADA